MYIVFVNDNPKEIHIDLEHAKKRKKFWQSYFSEESTTKNEVRIGEVLEWEEIYETEEKSIFKDPQYNIPEIDDLVKEISNDIDRLVLENMQKMYQEIESIFVKRGITKNDEITITYQKPNLYDYYCNGIPVLSVGLNMDGKYCILEHHTL